MAYTRGPGLAGALLVGAGVAVALAAALGKPALGIHHLEGHLLSPFLADDKPEFPFTALLVSGGHTQLMDVQGVGRYELLGETIDDAAGEAFDKSAKLLGLGYPGGPALARLAAQGHPAAFALPRPLLHSGDLDFSFAGLKTAVLTQQKKLGPQMSDLQRADLAASTQAAITDVLVAKSLKALQQTGSRRLVVAGGVGANLMLRDKLNAGAARLKARVHYPPLALCTDNGAMIALAAALRLQHGLARLQTDGAFDVRTRWPLAELSPKLQFEIRYATADNFLGTPVYEKPIARMQRPAAPRWAFFMMGSTPGVLLRAGCGRSNHDVLMSEDSTSMLRTFGSRATRCGLPY